jgi:hypothetical protein
MADFTHEERTRCGPGPRNACVATTAIACSPSLRPPLAELRSHHMDAIVLAALLL